MGGSGSGSSGFGGRSRGSGGGGTGAAGRGSGGGKPKFDCDAYTTKATLRSPKKVVIDDLDVGDQLRLKLNAKTPPILAVAKGRIAGSIVVPEQDDLIKCINKGTQYVADVISIEGGTCVVEIYAVEED